MEKKFLTKNGINLEIFDQYDSEIPISENTSVYVPNSRDIPRYMLLILEIYQGICSPI